MKENGAKSAGAKGKAPRPETLKKVTDLYRALGICAK